MSEVPIQEAFDAGFEAVKHYVDEIEKSFKRRIASLENRVVALEKKK